MKKPTLVARIIVPAPTSKPVRESFALSASYRFKGTRLSLQNRKLSERKLERAALHVTGQVSSIKILRGNMLRASSSPPLSTGQTDLVNRKEKMMLRNWSVHCRTKRHRKKTRN